MPKGKCRLCLTQEVELQLSHIMPRFSYVRVRGEGKGADPVHVTKGEAYQSQDQRKEYLLCWDCEQIFERRETYVASLLPLRDGKRAPILNMLGNAFETTASGTRAVELGRVSASDVAYFAASVLWRGHVSRGFRVELGSKYAEEFRRYLRDEAPFPSNAACAVTFFDIPFSDKIDLTATCAGVQTNARTPGALARSHGFMVMGLQFFFQLGSSLEPWVVASCIVRNGTMFLARQEQMVAWLAPNLLGATVDRRLAARMERG